MRLGLVCAILAIVAAPSHAQEDGVDWGIEKLMDELSKTPKRTVQFVEERHLALLSEPLVLEGTLSYKDGRLEKRTARPQQELAVIEKGRMRITSPVMPNARTVFLSDFPALEVFITSLRATLTGDLERLKRDFWVSYEVSGPDWRMTLTPLSEEARGDIDHVLVSGRDVRIASIEINERGGDRTVIRIRYN